ncbi:MULTISPECIES: chaplin [Streptomyces]|uniref:chaplin n=1 Tax=Streptomyces TaxID=1883 RepID=UPI00163B97BD|nr:MULTISPECIES: chaplin [Streptomyces]MBC2879360.1 chaplin [Streptomyces sp. TYQ1024]UBI39592.1 chaplin [Streptomyces mobaraensis]UKW32171.1 chaplin [Streptomyces sp. TYQ1024]
MKNMKKAAAVTIAAGGLALAGAGIASAHGGAPAAGAIAKNNPGVVSGNIVQVPVTVPVNLCSNTVNVLGSLNPTHGNVCVNE